MAMQLNYLLLTLLLPLICNGLSNDEKLALEKLRVAIPAYAGRLTKRRRD